jgi:DNA-binding response OmpR family regulator
VSRHKVKTKAAATSGIVEGPFPFNARVLLVDDVHEDAALLAAMLAPIGATVVVAGSVDEALAIFDEQFVDLVVTDLNMPGASGLDLACALRGRHNAPAVIFLTGSQSASDKIAAFELGAVAYLQKPVDVGHLIGLARDSLSSHCAERRKDAKMTAGAR